MPRTNTAVSQAVMLLKILRHIPERRLATLTQIQQSLSLDDIVINDQALRRNLTSLCEESEFRVTRERQGNTWFYRRESLEQTLATPTPEACLLLRLVEEELKGKFPDSLRHELKSLFNQSKEFFGENKTSDNRLDYLKKAAFIPWNLRARPHQIRSDVFSVIARSLYLDKVVKLTVVDRLCNQVFEHNTPEITGFFNPIRVVHDGDILFLVTPVEDEQRFMCISCSNIKKAELQQQQAVRPLEKDIDIFLGKLAERGVHEPLYHGIFVINDKRYIDFISFRPICPDQEIEKLSNEQYRVDLPYMTFSERRALERRNEAVFEMWEKVPRPKKHFWVKD